MLRKRLFRVVGVIVTVAALGMVVRGDAPRLPLQEPRVRKARPVLDPFLNELQERTFRFFWNRQSGKRSDPGSQPTPSFSSIAAVGFALSVPDRRRARLRHSEAGAAARTGDAAFPPSAARREPRGCRLQGLLLSLPRHEDRRAVRGQRALDRRHGDPAWRALCSVSPISTATDPEKLRFAASLMSIYRRVDWPWAQPARPRHQPGLVARGRVPRHDWRGYNEAMLVYILALGLSDPSRRRRTLGRMEAPTTKLGHALGQEHLTFAPLFGHQYTHVWMDFRGIQDRTCAGAASTISRTAGGRSTRSGPTRSPTDAVARTTAPTSGASRPATARPTSSSRTPGQAPFRATRPAASASAGEDDR